MVNSFIQPQQKECGILMGRKTSSYWRRTTKSANLSITRAKNQFLSWQTQATTALEDTTDRETAIGPCSQQAFTLDPTTTQNAIIPHTTKKCWPSSIVSRNENHSLQAFDSKHSRTMHLLFIRKYKRILRLDKFDGTNTSPVSILTSTTFQVSLILLLTPFPDTRMSKT
jgi:hypothetical protein